MKPAPANELTESYSQFVAAWRLFTSGMPGADVSDQPGLAAAWADVPLAVYNMLWVAGEVNDAVDLDERAGRAAKYMKTKRFPGMLVLCDDYLSRTARAGAEPILASHGLHLAMRLTGMAADELAPPKRPLPELEYRVVSGPAMNHAILDLNCHAYGFPIEWGRASAWEPEGWDRYPYGYVAYQAGQPVSSTATFDIDGRMYVGLVATIPEMQGRGYAEAVMRRSLEECARKTGLRRTILHATDAGRPVYLRMGYHETSKFTAYMASPE